MPKTETARRHEIEIKLRVLDLPALRRLLMRLSAREISPRTHESNTLYDTPTQDLRRVGKLIRIRVERREGKLKTKQGHTAVILTYKAPLRSSHSRKKSPTKPASKSRFKVKEEAEISLSEAGQMEQILQGLGLHPQFRYEKYRTTYLLPGLPSVKIELDETPVGSYLELEGSPAGIDRASSRLGYTRPQYITETYGALYISDCKRRGVKPGHMFFPATKKSRTSSVFP